MKRSDGGALDPVDEKIVAVLSAEGRLSIPQLAERVGVSRANAYQRFDRLVDDGVILGFCAVVDPAKVGMEVAAMCMVRTSQREWRQIADGLSEVRGVVWMALSAGDADFTLLVRARSLADLRDVVLEELLAVPGVDGIDTRVLLEERQRNVTPSNLPLDLHSSM